MGEYEVKKETKYEVDTHDAKDDVKEAGEEVKDDVKEAGHEVKEGAGDAKDKVKAGAKAVFNKVKDPDKDLETEYQKEKVKEKLD
jgi:hypothetical protein